MNGVPTVVGTVSVARVVDKIPCCLWITCKFLFDFFTVLFSALLLSERPTFWVVSSLVPIVGGVALASLTEASFNWIGFGSAMASNITNQSRNVLSKKFMVRKEEALDNINLFSVITIISFILLIPFPFLFEGFKLTPDYLKAAASEGVNVRELCIRSVLAGFCFHSYQQDYVDFSFVYDTTNGITSDTCGGELSEAGGGHSIICYLLSDTGLSHQLPRYRFGPCRYLNI
ncbi:hypothetical protein OSB04_028276 [Centaurea solstitialis]|uniref:Sugar phosphate transporter domain-containing protein n=1 Tax=Centaurea solstitialis TaxID=347529 RepID=A0AA38SFF5_9ASTR|nr:hypothetical protein OSB04_028276 [Centaurea solstitialis]